jgi:uncharacterized membrane protein
LSSTAPLSRGRESRALLLAVMAALIAALVWFVGGKAHLLTDYSPASYQDLWPRRAGLVPHLLGGATALIAGLVQIWLGLTHRTGRVHRVLGRVYVAGIVIGSVGGFYLAVTIERQFAYKSGLFCMDLAWLITTGMALYAIHRRRLEQHREWMLRSYVVSFAFVTFRLFDAVLRHYVSVPDSPQADDIAITMAWSCWAIPLLLAEPLIQLRNLRRTGPAARP